MSRASPSAWGRASSSRLARSARTWHAPWSRTWTAENSTARVTTGPSKRKAADRSRARRGGHCPLSTSKCTTASYTPRGSSRGRSDPGCQMKPILTRRQKDTIFVGIFCVVALLVVLQLWLLTATMNAYLGGDRSVVWPTAAASLSCLAVNIWLLRRLVYLQGARD